MLKSANSWEIIGVENEGRGLERIIFEHDGLRMRGG